jgi:tetratricopeptide (TPR) repeat protein
MANARRAIALDDTLAEAHTSLAAAYVLDWKWADAEREFQRALELNPNNAQAHQWYGNIFLGPMGRHSEAIAELRRAQELDPLSLIINTDLGYAYYLARQYDAAFQQYQKVLAVDPTFLPVHYDLMLYYHQRGSFDQELHERLIDETLAGSTAKTGGTFGQAGSPSPSASAHAYLALHRKEAALASLRKSMELRETGLIYLKVDPAWDSLRDDPEFMEIERRVGLLP